MMMSFRICVKNPENAFGRKPYSLHKLSYLLSMNVINDENIQLFENRTEWQIE